MLRGVVANIKAGPEWQRKPKSIPKSIPTSLVAKVTYKAMGLILYKMVARTPRFQIVAKEIVEI
eukprot:11541232-Prorocentrum_lima.AAC.1